MSIIYHKHHIVARHEWKRRHGNLDGWDVPENRIKITIEEHAEAHRKLWEEHGHWEDKLAWQALSGQITGAELNFEICRMAGLKQQGRKRSTATREKLRQKRLGKTCSDEVKAKISVSNTGKKRTEEQKLRISETCKRLRIMPPILYGKDNPFYGRKHTDETKRKISEAKKRKKLNIPE